jgi:hypothetical protein
MPDADNTGSNGDGVRLPSHSQRGPHEGSRPVLFGERRTHLWAESAAKTGSSRTFKTPTLICARGPYLPKGPIRRHEYIRVISRQKAAIRPDMPEGHPCRVLKSIFSLL